MEPIYFLKSFVGKRGSARRKAPRGFTLLEMTVVLAIIVILTAILLVSQNTFNRTLLVTDTAYTVALSIRETQTLGLSSQKFSTFANPGYGIDFSTTTPGSYIQFADIYNALGSSPLGWCNTEASTPYAKPGDCLYDNSTELSHTYTFNQGFTQSFCAYDSSGNPIGCSNSGTALQSLDILFIRPNTNTVMTATLTSGGHQQAYTACIDVSAPTGGSRFIKVTQLGEVSVTTACP